MGVELGLSVVRTPTVGVHHLCSSISYPQKKRYKCDHVTMSKSQHPTFNLEPWSNWASPACNPTGWRRSLPCLADRPPELPCPLARCELSRITCGFCRKRCYPMNPAMGYTSSYMVLHGMALFSKKSTITEVLDDVLGSPPSLGIHIMRQHKCPGSTGVVSPKKPFKRNQ